MMFKNGNKVENGAKVTLIQEWCLLLRYFKWDHLERWKLDSREQTQLKSWYFPYYGVESLKEGEGCFTRVLLLVNERKRNMCPCPRTDAVDKVTLHIMPSGINFRRHHAFFCSHGGSACLPHSQLRPMS